MPPESPDSNLTTLAYWSLDSLRPVDDDVETATVTIRQLLGDAVGTHLVSDVPVGVLLSGGVDSSFLAALAADESSEPLRTFSIGFEERSFDELADARRVAEHSAGRREVGHRTSVRTQSRCSGSVTRSPIDAAWCW